MIFLFLVILLLQPISVANAKEVAPLIRLDSKLNFPGQVKGDPEHRSAVDSDVHEHPGTGSDRAIKPEKQFLARSIDDSLVCMDAAMKFEKAYGIEQHVLTTIATVETGRWNDTYQRKMAWPWSINARGKSYYFASKAEAIEAANKLKKRGIKSFDVGCMQINMLHHGKGFDSIADAFDPYKNVQYAANFLTELNKRRQDWMHAATDYHSKQPSKARKYKNRLMLTMIEVVEGHDELANAINPKSNNRKGNVRTWFARLFGGRELAEQHIRELHELEQANTGLILSSNESPKLEI